MPGDGSRSQESSSRSSGAGMAFAVMAICVLSPVLYFLSIGPVLLVFRKTGSDLAILNFVYAPLIWLYQSCEPLRPLMDWYIKLWE